MVARSPNGDVSRLHAHLHDPAFMRIPLPAFLPVALSDLRGQRHGPGATESHLNAAVDWLLRAQDATPGGGVSYGYSLKSGWRPSYVETTGYIAPTFFDLPRPRTARPARPRGPDGGPALLGAAPRWLLRQRTARSRGWARVSIQGQVILGLTRAQRETGDSRFSTAVDRAGRWLVDQAANESGRWTRHTFRGFPHVYNTRDRPGRCSQANETQSASQQWERVGRANLDWALAQMRGTVVRAVCLRRSESPPSPTPSPTPSAGCGSRLLLSEPRYRGRGRAGRARPSPRTVRADDGFLPGRIDTTGAPRPRGYCCLDWKLPDGRQLGEDRSHRRGPMSRGAAVAVAAATSCRPQDRRRPSNPCVRGAIKGSQPVWGAYATADLPELGQPSSSWTPCCSRQVAAMRRVPILNGTFDALTLGQAADDVRSRSRRRERGYLCTVNVAYLRRCGRARGCSASSTVPRSVADRAPASSGPRPVQGIPFPTVAGIDLMAHHLRPRAPPRRARRLPRSEQARRSMAGGGRPTASSTSRVSISERALNGALRCWRGPDVARAVRDRRAILFVGMGVPRQEHLPRGRTGTAAGGPIRDGGRRQLRRRRRRLRRAPRLLQRVGARVGVSAARKSRAASSCDTSSRTSYSSRSSPVSSSAADAAQRFSGGGRETWSSSARAPRRSSCALARA